MSEERIEEQKRRILELPCIRKVPDSNEVYKVTIRGNILIPEFCFDKSPLECFEDAHHRLEEQLKRAFELKWQVIEQIRKETT